MRTRSALLAVLLLPVLAGPSLAQTLTGPPAPAASPQASSTSGSADKQTITAQMCNETGDRVYVAVAYPEGKSATTAGWTKIDSGGCAAIGPVPIDHRKVGFYASARGDAGMQYRGGGLGGGKQQAESRTWSGNDFYCVSLQRPEFTLHEAARNGSSATCPADYDLRGFIPVTAAVLYPGDTAAQNAAALKFNYTFKK